VPMEWSARPGPTLCAPIATARTTQCHVPPFDHAAPSSMVGRARSQTGGGTGNSKHPDMAAGTTHSWVPGDAGPRCT
jgi:hypothetical protein